jgi:mono/diheme cytochrome c family protein
MQHHQWSRIGFLPMLTMVMILLAVFSLNSCQDQPFKQGEILYTNFCANCHMEDGTGLAGNIPPLAGADYLKNNNLYTACIIRYGQEDTIVVNGITYSQPMAGIDKLSEFEIANVINYINQAWGNDYGFVKLEDIRRQLEDCD